jgi:hypothetical protein
VSFDAERKAKMHRAKRIVFHALILQGARRPHAFEASEAAADGWELPMVSDIYRRARWELKHSHGYEA